MYKCEYCNRTFKRENSLAVHMCVRKRRALSRTEKHVVAGYDAYNYWYKLAMGSKKNKTYEDFAGSQYYSAFVKFGRYVLDIRAISPENYIRWLTTNKIKLDTWSKDSVYNRYLKEHSKTESPDRAVERFVILAQDWSNRTGRHWSEYFERAPAEQIVQHIELGKISPWVIYSSDKAQAFIETCPAELLQKIANTLDPGFWTRKTSLFPDDVKWIRETIG